MSCDFLPQLLFGEVLEVSVCTHLTVRGHCYMGSLGPVVNCILNFARFQTQTRCSFSVRLPFASCTFHFRSLLEKVIIPTIHYFPDCCRYAYLLFAGDRFCTCFCSNVDDAIPLVVERFDEVRCHQSSYQYHVTCTLSLPSLRWRIYSRR